MKTLIVEDDLVIRVMLRRFLAPFGECDDAATGPAAVMQFKAALEANHPYNLVCLDIQLPGWLGIDVLGELRAIESVFRLTRHKCCRIMMVTSNSDPALIQRTAGLSDAYLLKPVAKSVLHDRLLSLGLIRESELPAVMTRELVKACNNDALSGEELGTLMTSAQASLARLGRSRVKAG